MPQKRLYVKIVENDYERSLGAGEYLAFCLCLYLRLCSCQPSLQRTEDADGRLLGTTQHSPTSQTISEIGAGEIGDKFIQCLHFVAVTYPALRLGVASTQLPHGIAQDIGQGYATHILVCLGNVDGVGGYTVYEFVEQCL